jgi:hypothetical protein
LACHLQIDADLDSAYHFDADPDPEFYLLRIRIRVPKMIWIHNTGWNLTDIWFGGKEKEKQPNY